MLQRLRNALQRDASGPGPTREYRPNELRREVVRAERIRREAPRAEPVARRPLPASEEQQPGRNQATAAQSTSPRVAPRPVTALKTRSGLRQAWLLKEILAPPMALRDLSGRDNDL